MDGAQKLLKSALLFFLTLFMAQESFARIRLNQETTDSAVKEEPEDKSYTYGAYRIQIGATKPTFTDLELYDKLYGATPMHFAFGVDWLPWRKYVGAGLRTKIGYFSDEGHTFTSTSTESPPPEESIEINNDGKTTFTIIPMQVAALVEFSPFAKKYLVLDAWFGFEYAYFQEVRVVETGEEASTSSTTTGDSDSESPSDSGALTNSGFKTHSVLGVGFNLQLNALDETSTRSMRSTMGIDSIYVTPYMEIISSSGDNLKLGRNTYGISFTFETI